MPIRLERNGVELFADESKLQAVEGFSQIEVKIPILILKTFIFKALTGTQPQVYGSYATKVMVYKSQRKYEKITLKISNGQESIYFPIYPNEVVGIAKSLQDVHGQSEQTLICEDLLSISRNDGKVVVEDPRIDYKYEIGNHQKDLLWGTLVLRLYFVKANGIFGDIALLGNTLKFPFTLKNRQILNPFCLEDTAKFLAIL